MEKQERIEQLRYELSIERQRGAMADAGKIEEIERQVAELEQERAEETQQEVAFIMDNLNLDGVTMREMFKNESVESAEAAYQVVRIAVQNTLLQRDEQWMTEVKDLRERLAAETAAKDVARAEADASGEANAKLVTEIRDLRAELQDTETKRDAAVVQLDEYKAEVTRLNSHIDDLRKQIAVGAANAVKVIDVGDSLTAWKEQKRIAEEEKRLAEEAREAAKPAIYDVQWGDHKRSFYVAKLAETDEEIRIPFLTIKSYREVSAEEAPQFRLRAEESQRVDEDLARTNDVEEGNDLTPPTWQFPEGEEVAAEESTTDRLAEEQLAGSSVETAEGTVTRAEFEELKRRVSELETPQSLEVA